MSSVHLRLVREISCEWRSRLPPGTCRRHPCRGVPRRRGGRCRRTRRRRPPAATTTHRQLQHHQHRTINPEVGTCWVQVSSPLRSRTRSWTVRIHVLPGFSLPTMFLNCQSRRQGRSDRLAWPKKCHPSLISEIQVTFSAYSCYITLTLMMILPAKQRLSFY